MEFLNFELSSASCSGSVSGSHDSLSLSGFENDIDHEQENLYSASMQLPAEQVRELLEEKSLKQQRLARKAQLARENRRKRKYQQRALEQQVEELKKKVAKLEEENSRLLACAPQGSAKEVPGECEEVRSHLVSRVAEFRERMNSLEKSLEPCLPLMFLTWVFSQDAGFYEDPSSMWKQLFGDRLGLTQERLEELKSLRSGMRKNQENKVLISSLLKQLTPLLSEYSSHSSSAMHKFVNILSSDELSRFMVWIDQNQLCVRMLASMQFPH